jgi:hypothetical protein
MASLRFLSFNILSGVGVAFMASALGGCSVQNGMLVDANPSAVTTSEAEPESEKAGGSDAAPPVDVCAAKPASGAGRRDQVCYRWRCDGRDAKTASKWTGNASSCSAGDLDPAAGERAVRLVNLHRFIAGVDPVTMVPSWSGAAQQCALVAHANAKLSHTPTKDWQCWSSVAAETSGVSLIANRSAGPAVGAYMEDPGNEATMVHRRWLLSPDLARVGIGSTDRYSCVVVDGRKLGDENEKDVDDVEPGSSERGKSTWVAWPPPGPVPMDVFTSERLDEVGWTIQSASSDLDRATKVTVTSSAGSSLPIILTHLTPLMGSRSAVGFVPDGWKTSPNETYAVSVTTDSSSSTKIDFVVEPVTCL